MPEDKVCRKCGKKESKSEFYFVSPYGLCNFCHENFLPYITKALNRFLKLKITNHKKVSISLEEKSAFVKKHYILMTKVLKYRDRLSIKKIVELARQELGYAESTVPCDILKALEKAYK